MPAHDKPTCYVCRKNFSTLRSLKRHEHLHTQTKPRLFCDICGNTFARTDSLDIHRKTHKGDVQTTIMSTAPLKLNQYPSEPLSSVKEMLLADPAQWESSKLNNDVTLTSQKDLLPGPIEPSVSSLGQTPSDKDLVLFEPDPEVSSRSNSVVTSIPQRTLLSGPIRPSILSSETSLQNVGQPLSQTYVHTLHNNNSTNNVFYNYPQPQVYEQSCQPGHESPDPSYRN